MIPSDVTRGQLIRDGKAKQVFETSDPQLVWIHYKDEATAFNGVKKAVIEDKGELNARISAYLMQKVADAGVPTHMHAILSPRDHLYRKVEIIPLEVVVRNITAGSIKRRFGIAEGLNLHEPMVEFFLKSDELNDPPVSDVHARAFGWALDWEMAYLRHAGLKVNAVLKDFWDGLGIDLVDFKLEFGRDGSGRILLADEITPDGSRLWEKGTQRKMDKDVFRRDLGDLSETYKELFERIFGQSLQSVQDQEQQA